VINKELEFMPKGIKQAKIADRQAAIDRARSKFFSGVTKLEAAEVFKLLSILSTFPGAVPPDPLSGCDVIWSSTLRVGDSIDKQVFDVQVTYRGLLFKHLSNGGSLIQLGDSTFMAFDNWDLEDDRLCKRVLDKLGQEEKISKSKAKGKINSAESIQIVPPPGSDLESTVNDLKAWFAAQSDSREPS
jgi:hypothetical protein